LTREDFEIKEDGKAVDVKTFVAVSARGSTRLDDGRSMVVLLDDVGMGPAATKSIRVIATYLASLAGPGDDLIVLRLSNRDDEPYGDQALAFARIGEYQAGAARFDPFQSTQGVLKFITDVARRFEGAERRRKMVVCVGSSRLCNVRQPNRYSPGTIWMDWVDAVGSAARANLSVYALAANRGGFAGGGLVEATGGELFASSSDLRPAIERIWEDASHHYLLGYWPSGSSRELHSIGVKVARKGVRVLARKVRGS
jgi:hypothetical protein